MERRFGIISLTFTFNKPVPGSALVSVSAGRLVGLQADLGCCNMIKLLLHWQFLVGLCVCVCVSEHMHVHVGGVPQTLLFSSESWEEGMSASQLSSGVRLIEGRGGRSVFASANILPSVKPGHAVHIHVCECVCGYNSGGWREGHTIVAPHCFHPLLPLMHI